MADKVAFMLELIDRLTAPARTMERALAGLTKSEETVTKASSAANVAAAQAGAAVAAAGLAAARGAAGFDKAARSLRSLAAARQATQSASWANVRAGFMAPRGAPHFGPIYDPARQGAAAGGMGPILDRRAQNFSFGQRLSMGIEDGTRKLMRWNTAAGDGIAKWRQLGSAFMGTPFGFILSGLGSIASMLGSILSTIGSMVLSAAKLALALGAVAAVSFSKQVVEMAAFGDRAKKALGYITGDKALGQKEFKEAVQLSEDLGTSVEDTVAHYSKLRSMQFSRIESAGLVRLSADLKAITGDAQSAERALTAMTQIKAKGKLQSEELVGQLAEAGVSTVLVYQELEKILGTDRAGVLKKLQGGQVDSETGLVAIVRALKAKYHVDSFGAISGDAANNTMGGLWEALKSDVDRALLRVSDDIDRSPLITTLRNLRQSFQNAFSDGAAATFVDKMIVALTKAVPLVEAFFKGFGDGLGGIADALTISGDPKELQAKAEAAGKTVADFFKNVIATAKVAVPEILKATDAFIQGLDVNQLIKDLKTVDFKALAADMVTIGKALGVIANAAAKLAEIPLTMIGQDGVTRKARNAALPENVAKSLETQASIPRESKSYWDLLTESIVDPGRYGVEPRASLQPRAGQSGGTVINNTVRVEGVYVDANNAHDPRETGERTQAAVSEGVFNVFNTRLAARAYR